MALISPALAASIARRHGVVTVEAPVADGTTLNTIKRLVRDGTLVRTHHGVPRVATSPDTFESRCVAACARDDELVGIRVASPPRAWFDCARDLDDEKFERLTEWLLDHHTTMTTLWRLTGRMATRGRPGLGRVHRVMSRRSDWQRPARSGLELRVLLALEARGVGPLVRQHRLVLANGLTIHVDGASPSVRWALEVDHVTWHGGRSDAQRDKGHDRGARRLGWQVDSGGRSTG